MFEKFMNSAFGWEFCFGGMSVRAEVIANLIVFAFVVFLIFM